MHLQVDWLIVENKGLDTIANAMHSEGPIKRPTKAEERDRHGSSSLFTVSEPQKRGAGAAVTEEASWLFSPLSPPPQTKYH